MAQDAREDLFEEDSKHIAGDFLETLKTCRRFLDDHIGLNKNRAGFIQNVVWALVIQQQVDDLRSQLQFHTQALVWWRHRLILSC